LNTTLLRCAIALTVSAASISVSYAQAYPNAPINMIIPYPPAGATDKIGRLLALGMSKKLGQSIIVENRAGATGTIGMQAAVNASPEGYTIVLGTGGTVAVDITIEKLPYNPVRDLTAIAPVVSIPFVMVANMNFPPRNIGELVAYAKREPGKINFASSGTGGPAHLATEYLMALNKIKMVHIPYKGAAAAYNDVVGGQVDFMTGDVASALGFIQGNRLKAIAVTGSQRLALLPNVPTVAESGQPGYEAGNWFGIFGPAKMPADVVAKLSKAVMDTVQEAEFKRGIEPLGGISLIMNKPDFERYITAQTKERVDLLKSNNIVLER
jgi:tripartite-type tricarboxylate transporter receptor subunit TctC